jgi:hypothetical protein
MHVLVPDLRLTRAVTGSTKTRIVPTARHWDAQCGGSRGRSRAIPDAKPTDNPRIGVAGCSGREEACDEKSARVFVLCGIELNRAKQILATVREMAPRNKTHLLKTMKTNPLFKFLGIATIGAAVAGTAVAGPSGGYTFRSLLGFGAGCPMRTPETKLVFVNTPKNMGISQIVTGYRYKGCIGKSEKTMTCPGSNLTCLQMIRS